MVELTQISDVHRDIHVQDDLVYVTYILDDTYFGVVGKQEIFDGDQKIAVIDNADGNLSIQLLTQQAVELRGHSFKYKEFCLQSGARGSVYLKANLDCNSIRFTFGERLNLCGSIECDNLAFVSNGKGKGYGKETALFHDSGTNYLKVNNLAVSGYAELLLMNNRPAAAEETLHVKGRVHVAKHARILLFDSKARVEAVENFGAILLCNNSTLNAKQFLQAGKYELRDSQCHIAETFTQRKSRAELLVTNSSLSAKNYGIEAGLVKLCGANWRMSSLEGDCFDLQAGKLEILGKSHLNMRVEMRLAQDSVQRIDMPGRPGADVVLPNNVIYESVELFSRSEELPHYGFTFFEAMRGQARTTAEVRGVLSATKQDTTSLNFS